MKTSNDFKRRPNSGDGSLGQFFRRRSVLVHKSCDVAMLPHPANPEGPRVIPWITPKGKGVTRVLGRNKMKRFLRSNLKE